MTKHYEHSWPENKDIQTDRPVPYPEVKAYTVAAPNLAGTLPGTMKPKEKRGRNLLANDLKVQTGHNICEIWIPEQYAKGGQP